MKQCFDCRILPFSADVLTDYVEYLNGENSKKKSVGEDSKECVDHLLVEEDVDLQPLPTDEEIRMDRRGLVESGGGSTVKLFTIPLWSGWI